MSRSWGRLSDVRSALLHHCRGGTFLTQEDQGKDATPGIDEPEFVGKEPKERSFRPRNMGSCQLCLTSCKRRLRHMRIYLTQLTCPRSQCSIVTR